MIHLTDHALPITPTEVVTLFEIVHGFTCLTFKVIGRQGAICHYSSGEPLQYVTRRDPKFVRWLAEGWNQHFKAMAEAVAR